MKINLDSPVIVFLTTVADFMMLNILFILCCQCPLHDYYARGKT